MKINHLSKSLIKAVVIIFKHTLSCNFEITPIGKSKLDHIREIIITLAYFGNIIMCQKAWLMIEIGLFIS